MRHRFTRFVPYIAPTGLGVFVILLIALQPVTVPTGEDTVPPTPSPAPVTIIGASATAPSADDGAIRPVTGIFAGITVAQQIPVTGTHISSVALFLATYQRVNHGLITVNVQTRMDGRWTDLATRTVNKETLVDNAFLTVSFSPPLVVEPRQPLRVTLRADGGPPDAISWWMDTRIKAEGYVLSVNDKPIEGTARFRVMYMPASGRLITIPGQVWGRMTVFLAPFWRIILGGACCVLAGSVFLLNRHLRDDD